MNLSDELEAIAVGAPQPPAADKVVRLARARRQRRLVAIPALLILVIVAPAGLLVVRGDFVSSGVRQRYTYEMGGLSEGIVEIMQRRAEALGLDDPRVTVDGFYLTLEVEGAVDEADLKAFEAPGRLEIRKVIRQTLDEQPPPTPAPASQTIATTAEAVKAKAGGLTDLRHPALATLLPSEVALLPAWAQADSPLVRCDQLNAVVRPVPPAEELTACSGGEKLYMAAPSLDGRDVVLAIAIIEPVTGHPFINLELSTTAPPNWNRLVHEALTRKGCELNSANCLVAFVVDGKVQSAPQISAPEARPGFYVPSGSKRDTARLAAIIGPNELPRGFTLSRA